MASDVKKSVSSSFEIVRIAVFTYQILKWSRF